MQYGNGSKEHFSRFYSSQLLELFDNLNQIKSSFFKLSFKDQVNILSYGYSSNNPISLNKDIFKLVINFLTKSGRFYRPKLHSTNECMLYIYLYIYIYIYI